MHTWSCSKYFTLLHEFCATELFSWKKSGKYRNDSQFELSLFVAVDLFKNGSKLSEFILSDVPSNALLLTPNELGTVFELGVQRLETFKELEIQTDTNEAGARKKIAQQVIRSTYVQSDSQRILFFRFLIATHVKVIPRLGVSYSSYKYNIRRYS